MHRAHRFQKIRGIEVVDRNPRLQTVDSSDVTVVDEIHGVIGDGLVDVRVCTEVKEDKVILHGFAQVGVQGRPELGEHAQRWQQRPGVVGTHHIHKVADLAIDGVKPKPGQGCLDRLMIFVPLVPHWNSLVQVNHVVEKACIIRSGPIRRHCETGDGQNWVLKSTKKSCCFMSMGVDHIDVTSNDQCVD